jgi:hypothetical protein
LSSEAKTADDYIHITRRLALPVDAIRVLGTLLALDTVPQTGITFGGKTSDRRVARAVERLAAEKLIEVDVEDGGVTILHALPIEQWENETHFMRAVGVRWPA